MKCLVVYMSRYGSTKRYAERIGDRLKCPVVAHTLVDSSTLAEYETVILGTCVLEGQIEAARLYQSWIEQLPQKHWILFTVGLSNPVFTNFEAIMHENFNEHVMQQVQAFHFRGTIVYKRLEFMERLLRQMEETQAESFDMISLGEFERTLLERYGTTYDWKDESATSNLIRYVRQLEEGE